MRRSEEFLKGGDETSKSAGKQKMGSEVFWIDVNWSDDFVWNVSIMIDL